MSKRKFDIAHEKMANQRTDYLHKAPHKLINENQIINIETLKVNLMLKHHTLVKSISDASWSTFVDMLYEDGRTVNMADVFYASSQLCHVCGNKNSEVKNLAVSERTYPDCHRHDRDYNTVKNLLSIV